MLSGMARVGLSSFIVGAREVQLKVKGHPQNAQTMDCCGHAICLQCTQGGRVKVCPKCKADLRNPTDAKMRAMTQRRADAGDAVAQWTIGCALDGRGRGGSDAEPP